jgi:hypothetical protein
MVGIASYRLHKIAIFVDLIRRRAIWSLRMVLSLPTHHDAELDCTHLAALALAATAALARHLAGGPALFLAHRSGRPTLALTHRGSRYALGPKSTAAPRQRRRTQPTSRPQAVAQFPGSGGSGCSPRLHLVQLGARDSKVASSFISSTAAMVASPSFRSAIKVCALKPYQL